ncbi:MerR family transcriptional regulator [uncultured Pseudokineococcus sp.]|uniref:MerR family transcriptional regulator n=1 Tax=uncultured Pseudokineococcus sp. TaxID=1642928 RepID=UPI0026211AB6|nr:MerR family transcriptional regulator [uncultured Pseudokineococcus sp.]
MDSQDDSTAALAPVTAQDGAPTLKVAAVARRLGVAPATLRTWARRYDLGPSAHTAGAHRQYSLEDLDRLMVMRRMTLEGYSPAEAARVAVQTSGTTSAGPAARAPEPARAREVQPPAEPGPALRATSPSVRSLARAAMALQAGECGRQLEASTAVSGVVETWTGLARPVLQALADRVGAVAPGRSPGALLESAVMAALRGVADAEPVSGPSVLVVRPCVPAEGAARATPDGPTGDLLSHVVAAALREEGADSSVLPGAHPAERVAAVAEQVDAAVLVVVSDAAVGSAAAAETGRLVDPDGLRVLLVGRGWGDGAPAPVVPDLGDVVAAALA